MTREELNMSINLKLCDICICTCILLPRKQVHVLVGGFFKFLTFS